MWHKNEGPKPTGRVLVRMEGGFAFIAEWFARDDTWIADEGYTNKDSYIHHWHEIPPFEGEGEGKQ